MKYYIKPDSKLNSEFPDKDTAPVLEPADGLQEVNVPATSVQYFIRYWWQYRLLGNGRLQAPGNLPSLDIDYLQGIIDQQADKLDQTLGTLGQVQTALTNATKSQVEAQQQFVATQASFQKQFVGLSQQIVALQKQVADATKTDK